MVVLFLGAPGSGKGTQSKIFSEDLKIAHLSTGDILRKEVERKKVTRARTKDCENGFILDGFPRNFAKVCLSFSKAVN